jgi:hypothetical protein
LARCFTYKDSAAVVGRAYLQCVPEEADVQLLVDLICVGGAEQQAELACADKGKLREFLLHQQRQDFARERIVKVHGWLLSATEVRLCALAALL